MKPRTHADEKSFFFDSAVLCKTVVNGVMKAHKKRDFVLLLLVCFDTSYL